MACTRKKYVPSAGFTVPCGKCLECRKSRSKRWSLRLAHELAFHDKACFITLTYDDDHFPFNGSISKVDFQNFLKRLRKRIEPDTIKYFACGEYGDNTFRPHYHAIIFGIDDESIITQCWPFGFTKVGTATMQSISYTCGYVTKKIQSKEDKFYTDSGLVPPFQLQSRGIGLEFALQNKALLMNKDQLKLNGVSVPVPRYYRTKLELDTARASKGAAEQRDKAIEEIERRHGSVLSVKKHLYASYEDAAERYLEYLKDLYNIDSANELTDNTVFNMFKKSKL